MSAKKKLKKSKVTGWTVWERVFYNPNPQWRRVATLHTDFYLSYCAKESAKAWLRDKEELYGPYFIRTDYRLLPEGKEPK